MNIGMIYWFIYLFIRVAMSHGSGLGVHIMSHVMVSGLGNRFECFNKYVRLDYIWIDTILYQYNYNLLNLLIWCWSIEIINSIELIKDNFLKIF